jgi:hypothetical protein
MRGQRGESQKSLQTWHLGRDDCRAKDRADRATSGRSAAAAIVSTRQRPSSISSVQNRPAHDDAGRHAAESASRWHRAPQPVNPDELLWPTMVVRRLSNLMVRDLRRRQRPYVSRSQSVSGGLALAEAAVPQIATFTGHSLKDVEAILDAHYLGRDLQLAEAAVLKLEKRTKL